MTYSLENIADSIAGVLKARYPDYPVYTSASQQGTEFPCFFVFFMPSSIRGEIGRKYFQDLGVDVIFVQQRNVVNGNDAILEIAQFLDENMGSIPYTDGSGALIPLHTMERQWQMEDQELHYQFHIRQRVAAEYRPLYMKEMEEDNASIKKEGTVKTGRAGGRG